MRNYDVYKLTKELIGKIEPYGDARIDEIREENIKEHIELAHFLVIDLIDIVGYEERPEASMKKINKEAREALSEIKEILINVL